MPKTLPTIGDYAYFKLKDGSTKIGRVVAAYKKDGEEWVRLRYWYDAFTGHDYTERCIEDVDYTIQPRGVNIECVDKDQPSSESNDPFRYMHEMSYKSALIMGIQTAAKQVLEATAVPTAPSRYISAINSDNNSYYLNQSSVVSVGRFTFAPKDRNPYQYYPSGSLARLAYANKKFNDMLLAYRAAYDNDFCPDWTNSQVQKHYVLYNAEEKKYVSSYCYTLVYSTVFFSSYRIAEECADWLNSLGITPDKLYHEIEGKGVL